MFSLARKALVQVIMPVRAPFYVFLSAVVLRRCWSGSPLTQHRNGGHIMFNRKSSYALNKKDPNAIVYMDANEAIIRLTREDFASEEEFLKWKSWSDGNYHTEDNQDVVEGKHNSWPRHRASAFHHRDRDQSRL